VAVALHETRHNHAAGEPIIYGGRAKGINELRATDRKDTAVAHGDMRGDRQARVYRYNAAGLEYPDCGNGRFGGHGQLLE
jgi:hypothetical protein